MSKVIIADTETTGVSSIDEIIEFSYVELKPLKDFKSDDTPFYEKTFFNQRYMPSVPIQKAALECHGIHYKDLLGKPKSETLEFPKDVTYMIGHNISFDHRMLGRPEVLLICTMQLSRKLSKFLNFPFTNHKLDTLATELSNGEYQLDKYHGAMKDVQKNIFVLRKWLEKLPGIQTWDDLYSLQEQLKTPKSKKG